MGVLSSGLEWWEEWQLRVLVLSSLCVQFFLFFSIWVRRVPGLRRLRVVVWMAYIGGDALAIYALASLFNRHSQHTSSSTAGLVVESMSRSRRGLEVLWAPVLLIHLGGHVTLSAFSLEDNELWLRHVITLVSQVTVALYVFCKWWSGELRLLLAAVMLFLFGILKFSLKPWALRRASYSQMLSSTDVSPQREQKCTSAWWTWCTSNSRGAKSKKEGDGVVLSLDDYVKQAAKMMCTMKKAASRDQEGAESTVEKAAKSSAKDAELPMSIAIGHTDYFVDLSAPYSCRLSDLRYLQNLPHPAPQNNNNNKKVTNASYNMLQKCFEATFDLLYTRVGFTVIESLLVILLPFLALASVVLFATGHKHGYNSMDVKVTYILFSCTTLLEFLLPFCGIVLPAIPCLKFLIEYIDGWHHMVSQYDLTSYYIRKKKPTVLMKFVLFECLREYVSKVWYVRHVPTACEITELIQLHIEDGWKRFVSDAATYRRFSDLRGQLTLKKHQHQLGLRQKVLGDSLRLPFDKSVLLWHIATELCFHQPKSKASLRHSYLSTRMSDYMLYLLFIHAEMLLPGTRPGIFTVAIYELEDILKESNAEVLEKKEALAQEIIKHANKSTLIHEACTLVAVLMELREVDRWEIIQGVWVEMLCYSASRCRGYLHAKSLGEGGEYLSYVWLLWSYMGMETLADKIQKPECPDEKEILIVDHESDSWSQGGPNHQSSTADIPDLVRGV